MISTQLKLRVHLMGPSTTQVVLASSQNTNTNSEAFHTAASTPSPSPSHETLNSDYSPTVRLVTKRPSRWVNKLRLIGKIDEKNFLILKFSLSNEMRRESEKVPENGKDQGAKTKHDESSAANRNIHHLHPDSDI